LAILAAFIQILDVTGKRSGDQERLFSAAWALQQSGVHSDALPVPAGGVAGGRAAVRRLRTEGVFSCRAGAVWAAAALTQLAGSQSGLPGWHLAGSHLEGSQSAGVAAAVVVEVALQTLAQSAGLQEALDWAAARAGRNSAARRKAKKMFPGFIENVV
jgi:hypothetical protein